jgi:hypothetical protein
LFVCWCTRKEQQRFGNASKRHSNPHPLLVVVVSSLSSIMTRLQASLPLTVAVVAVSVLLLSVSISSIECAGSSRFIQVNNDTKFFIDSFNRTRLFHGVNAVYATPRHQLVGDACRLMYGMRQS